MTVVLWAGLAWAVDADGDGYDQLQDCNDGNRLVYPGAPEIVADGIDEDCDGGEICWADPDDDGARSENWIASADTDCRDPREGETSDPIDCNDLDASVHPGAIDVVGDGIDSDCDGIETCFADRDGDGARTDETVPWSGPCAIGVTTADALLDCDDESALVHPGATEAPGDGIDADCDGTERCYADADRDGYRSEATVPSSDPDCADPGEAGLGALVDCDDSDAAVHPSAADLPDDGVDQNCDGADAAPVDADADGWAAGADCDDTDDRVNPGVFETPGDGVDQNCDGSEDCYEDKDLDGARGYTVSAGPLACDAPGFEPMGAPMDCDDSDAARSPTHAETPGNAIDEDCDDRYLCYADTDADGARTDEVRYGAEACAGTTDGLAADPIDCDDQDPRVGVGPEIPDDGLDEDCDGRESCHVDIDGDGVPGPDPVAGGRDGDLDCTGDGELPPAVPADCDDDDPARHPGAVEVDDDGIDQNCDGSDHPPRDDDGDGYRSDVDCDDGDPGTHPGAYPVIGDDRDQDCDGYWECWEDTDGDGDGISAVRSSADADCDDPGESATRTDPCPDDPLDLCVVEHTGLRGEPTGDTGGGAGPPDGTTGGVRPPTGGGAPTASPLFFCGCAGRPGGPALGGAALVVALLRRRRAQTST